MTLQEQIELYLDPLPSEWKKKLTTLLCEIAEQRAIPDCEAVKECETLTSLSNFTLAGTTVSVVYKGENNVNVTRSFDVNQLLNNQLQGVNPACLTSESNWNTLTFPQRIQLLIDKHCECCD